MRAVVKWLLLPFVLMGASEERDDGKAGKYLNNVVNKFEKEIEKEFKVKCCKFGASMPKDIEKITIGFEKPKKGTIEEARVLAVGIMQRFLDKINQDEDVRPYLREHPFTRDRVLLTLSFTDEDICYVTFIRDELEYLKSGEKWTFITALSETLEEALKKMEGGAK